MYQTGHEYGSSYQNKPFLRVPPTSLASKLKRQRVQGAQELTPTQFLRLNIHHLFGACTPNFGYESRWQVCVIDAAKSRSTKFDVRIHVYPWQAIAACCLGHCGNCRVSESPVVDAEINTYNCICVSPDVEQIRTYFDTMSHIHGQSDT